MPELLVPISQQREQADRLVEGVLGLHYDPARTHVTVLNVFEAFEVHSETWQDVDSDEFYDAEDLPEEVTAAASRLTNAGFTVDVRREHGDPAETIIDVASEIGADAIAMAARQRSPIGKVLLGSVTQGVLLGSDRPVIVIPDED